MSCFSCIHRRAKDVRANIERYGSRRVADSSDHGSEKGKMESSSGILVNGKLNSPKPGGGAQSFTFKELAAATRNFKEKNLLGEGGFGRVYKGRLESGEIVAIKQLNPDSLQGNQEFIVEVLMLSLLHHPNLVTLTGYCTSGDQRLLVYEFMPKGSLEDHLLNLEPDKQPLSWDARIKIAAGAARGLEYLHCRASPPVIYRDLKSANILLDKDLNPKLSDFGLAKLGPVGDRTHVSTRVMGTYGYCAPEYAMSGKLTLRSDIYSFGVVLLELVTGRRANDNSRPRGQRTLVSWSRPYLKDQKYFGRLADPLLQGRYSRECLNFVVAIAAVCLNEEAPLRPVIGDIAVSLQYLASQCEAPKGGSQTPQTPEENAKCLSLLETKFQPPQVSSQERKYAAAGLETPQSPVENAKSLGDFLGLG